MSSRLEQFIKDHREEFDADEPAPKVWDDVRQQLEPGTKQETPVIRFNFFRWSAAAAVVILLGSGIWYFSRNNGTSTTENPVAKIDNDLPARIQPSLPSLRQLQLLILQRSSWPPMKLLNQRMKQKKWRSLKTMCLKKCTTILN